MKKFKSKEIKTMIFKMRWRVIGVWTLNAIVPILVFIAYISFMYGPDTYVNITNPRELNTTIWQLEKWNNEEQVFRYLNNIVLEDPNLLLLDETYAPLREMELINSLKYVVIIRKENKLFSVNDFDNEAGRALIKEMQALDSPILPEYGSDVETSNRELLSNTGYSVMKQYDFMFSDGDHGSIFFMPKVVNIPHLIGDFILKYLLVLLFIYICTVGTISIVNSYKFSKKFEKLVIALEEISKENFDIHVNITQKDIFGMMGEHINNMAMHLSQAKTYREESEISRNEFINSMTHDIKTPLTAINMQVEALKDGMIEAPEQIQRYYENIQRKVQSIDQMMGELKLFNELQQNEASYQFQKIAVNNFIQDVIDEWKYDVAGESVEYHLDFKLDSNDCAFIEPLKMKRVINNILENAIKYVEDRPLILLIETFSRDGWHMLRITDNGRGVPENYLQSIFSQYFRVDDARNQTVPGSGLGLAICKKIIEAHGGTIVASNSDGLSFEIALKGV